MDGVSALLEELADIADALVDRLGPDAEEGGDDDLRQGEPLMQSGGQEAVGLRIRIPALVTEAEAAALLAACDRARPPRDCATTRSCWP